jgi:hypothetical protein
VLHQRIIDSTNWSGTASSPQGLHRVSVGRVMNAADSRMPNVDQPEQHIFRETNGSVSVIGPERSQRQYDESEPNVIANRRQISRPVSGHVVFADQVCVDLFVKYHSPVQSVELPPVARSSLIFTIVLVRITKQKNKKQREGSPSHNYICDDRTSRLQSWIICTLIENLSLYVVTMSHINENFAAGVVHKES